MPAVQSITLPAKWLREWFVPFLQAATILTQEPDAALRAGEWCRWCPAAFKCPELLKQTQTLARVDFAGFVDTDAAKATLTQRAAGLTDDEIAMVLRWTPIIDAWLRAVNAHAYEKLRGGGVIPGYKLVTGRGRREWLGTSEETIAALFAAGLLSDEKDLYEPATLKSPAQLEQLSKEAKAAVKQVAVKRPGALTLTVESDRRNAQQPTSEFAGFATAVPTSTNQTLEDLGI